MNIISSYNNTSNCQAVEPAAQTVFVKKHIF